MNQLVWAVPLGLALVLLVPVVLAALQVLDEARRLAGAARDWRQVRPAVLALRTDARGVRATIEDLTRR